MRNIYVPLPEGAVDQLRELARHEMRDTKSQAAVLILDGLRRAGHDGRAARAPRDEPKDPGR
jgi:hypothetical protein